MSWCSDAPEDEAISLFAGLLANPDVPLSLCETELLKLQKVMWRSITKDTGPSTFTR
jgi:hypothetical protein